jgi:hypothetical protein
MTDRDPLEVLDLRPGATLEEVHAAYIRLAKLVHPDRFTQDPDELQAEAARRMTELNLAYKAAVEKLEEPVLKPAPGRTMCPTCETSEAQSWRCTRCGTWWDRTTCAGCGKAGLTTGGAGALYLCPDCANRRHPSMCPNCAAPMARGGTCGSCDTPWESRLCSYCGSMNLLADASSEHRCRVCHQIEPGIA